MFTDDEVRRLFAVIDFQAISSYSNKAMVDPVLFRVLYGAGLRVSETLNLNLSDVDTHVGTLRIRDSKNGESRTVPVTRRLTATLEGYITAAHPTPESSDYPHPGAQLSLFDTVEGMRHQVFITDTPGGRCSVQLLELRHRGHARVEDRIRTGKDCGFGRFPSRMFAINAAWLQLALVGIDLLAWTRTLLLDGEHTLAEPKKLRYRLLHVAARIVRTARRTYLRIAQTWPWASDLAAAFDRLAALPRPLA